jgi:hypothetical protein
LDSNTIDQLGKFEERRKVTFRNKLLIYFIFLCLSALFWLLIALGKNYTTNITFPIECNNLPKNKVLVGDIPDKLILKVNSNGFTLLKYKIATILKPIEFDVNSYSLNIVQGNKFSRYYLLTKFAQDKITDQISTDIRIIKILPDTLFFQFADMAIKKVAVVPNIHFELDKQYMLKGKIMTIPDSINILGPDIVLDTITSIKTLVYDLKDIKQSVKQYLSLSERTYVTLSQNKILLFIDVEKCTEFNISIPIETTNLPIGYQIKLFPAFINLSFNVGLSQYNRISANQFKAVVDYNEVESNISDKLQVLIAKYPKNIGPIKYQPKLVEYIIEK